MKRAGIFLSFIAMLILVGCGFHLRNAADLPPELRALVVEFQHPYGSFQTRLLDQLRALHVELSLPHSGKYPLHLVILKNELLHSSPSQVSTNIATPYSFTLITTAVLQSPNGKILVGPQTFSSSHTLVLNNNQIFNTSIGSSTREEITRDNISKLYFWLISNNTRKALADYANHRS